LPQIFGPRADAYTRWLFLGVVLGAIFVVVGGALWLRSSFVTDTGRPIAQVVPFSHAHHVGALGIDCRYCHTSVETSAFAGLPATEVCMTCHSQIWTNAAMLAPVRKSFASGQPLAWNRVNSVGDFVYFNHAIHVNKGVACVTCHGQVDRMPLMQRENPMQMEWCLGCHRNPAPNLRPKDAVFDPEWKPPMGDVAAMHQVLMNDYHIDPRRLTDCYVCHR
jgi:hypothetical protein